MNQNKILILVFLILICSISSCKKEDPKTETSSTQKTTFDNNFSAYINGQYNSFDNVNIQIGNSLFIVYCQDDNKEISIGTFIDTENPFSEIGDTNELYDGFSHIYYNNVLTQQNNSGYLIITSVDTVNNQYKGIFKMTTLDTALNVTHVFTNGNFSVEDQ